MKGLLVVTSLCAAVVAAALVGAQVGSGGAAKASPDRSTSGPAFVRAPTVPASAADGTILFNSWRNGGPALWYTVRGDGSSYRIVLGERAGSVAGSVRLSPDGRMLAFGCQSFRGSLCVAASNGSNRRLLVRGAGPLSGIASFDWSPDGRRIVYINRLGVWITTREGTNRVRIVAGRARGIGQYGPVGWSRAGGWIGFMGRGRNAGARPRARIYLVHPNGTRLHAAGDFPLGGQRLSWSPDDRGFALSVPSRDRRHSLVIVVDSRTGTRRVLARGINPAYAPDGTHIAFVGEAFHLRVIAATGGRSRKLAPAYYGVVWSPQSDRIAFDCCDGRTLSVVGLDGTGRRRLARARYNDLGRGGEMQWVGG